MRNLKYFGTQDLFQMLIVRYFVSLFSEKEDFTTSSGNTISHTQMISSIVPADTNSHF